MTADAALAAEVDSAVPCERCGRAAEYLVVHRELCVNGQDIPPPLNYAMCKSCLDLYAGLIAANRVSCVACEKSMDKMSHAVESVEKI